MTLLQKGQIHRNKLQAASLRPLLSCRTLALGATGFCYRVEGNYSEVGNCFSQVIRLAIGSNLVFLCFMYSIVQALVYLVQGRLRDDIEACQISLALDVEQGSNTSFAGLAYSVMVNSQTTFPLQKVMPKEGLELVTRDGDIYYVADGYHTLAQKSGSSPL